ncbi:histidine phosphotransferase [Altericroceibacterium spongiae]|uniref:Histidine phosphotransferase n=1 Tax=Altericroceibacterium spongiae TaxID=2320269 RepID=A0A420EK32_9SPHN|nr:histidine phosphotransferase family protein [Altericroceibacterium spongiae]RKF21082.1 histidine phosphotransferase [Altericroceibacterium spongiae]
MTVSPADLASLLCSRLCHDMLSPVGALTNGLELLSEEQDPDMRQRCFELLEQSAHISASKLKFFRLAYGGAGHADDMVSLEEPRALIAALAGDNGRITLDWQVGGTQMARPAVKMLLNLAAIGMDALPRGGKLDIAGERGEQATELVVRASGTRIAFDPTIGEALDGSLDESRISARTAPAYMMYLLADNAGGGVQYMQQDDALILGAVLPQV